MADNENQNNLERSVRDMIRDRIAKLRKDNSESKAEVKGENEPIEVKTVQPVIKEEDKPVAEAKAVAEEKTSTGVKDGTDKNAAPVKNDVSEEKAAHEDKVETVKKEEPEKKTESEEKADAEDKTDSETLEASEGKAAAENEAKDKAAESNAEVQEGEKKAEHGHGEGVWKTFVERMNSESAGDDATGTDIEDEAVDEIFVTPEEQKRKKVWGRVKLYSTIGAIAAIAILIAFFTVRNNSFRHIYEQGVKAYNDEDYDSAVATFEKLALSEEGEKNVDVLNYLAESYIKKNRYSDALDVYNKALQADPTFGPAITGLCEMYTRMKDGKSLNATLDKYRGSNMEEYIAAYMVADPAVNPDAGKYEDDLEIAITGEESVPIFYTLDGSDPNEQSQIYSKPIKASEGTTNIKAIAINTLGIRSGIIDKSYTVEYPIPDEPKIALNSGIYVTGQTVTISGDEGCDIYYTTDGSTPTSRSDKYTGPLRLVKGNVILTAISISNHGKESGITSKNYIIVQNAKELEEVEKMNNPSAESEENKENENGEGSNEDAGSENPNENDPRYDDEESDENSENEGLFDWLLNDRR